MQKLFSNHQFLFIPLIFILFIFTAAAGVINVPSDYLSIQLAIDASQDGDEIVVSPEAYTENIDFNGKNIILRSIDPSELTIVESTIIDGNEEGSVVTFSGAETSDCIITGFTITNGLAENGGGISGNRTQAKIENNRILYNNAENGGGICDSDGVIQNNIIFDNYAAGYGGGVSLCDGFIINNTICYNSAEYYGGGLFNCNGIVVNCIFWGNSASDGNQVYNYGSLMAMNCCIQNWIDGGKGNISSDPRFVDSNNGDFHLLSNSSCIDKGNSYYLVGDFIVDIDGEGRIAASSVDIGCDEFNSEIDSDGDFLVDSHEDIMGSDSNNPDTDGDGLNDGKEILRGTNPLIADTPTNIFIPDQFASIQQAIFLAFPSEVLTISPETYYENLVFIGKNIILRSTNPMDPSVVESTTINGNHTGSVITFYGTESSNCILSGLTITNGFANLGGGIKGNGTLATIQYNRVVENSTYGAYPDGDAGGGIYYCNGLIHHNIISNNFTNLAGGGLAYCYGEILNNSISNNTAYWGGGIIYCDAIIRNNLVFNNTAVSLGGGFAGGHAFIENNTIYGNIAGEIGGAFYNCDDFINNNIFWANYAPVGPEIYASSPPFYCCIQNWTEGGEGNIMDNPQLVNPDDGDFHLKAISPCIDAGCYIDGLTQDFEGDSRGSNGTPNPRGDGSDYDIGADEYVSPTMDVKNWSLWD